MTEQVIDIRDRIEKMRNQMTVPSSKGALQEKKIETEKVQYRTILEKKSENNLKDIVKPSNDDENLDKLVPKHKKNSDVKIEPEVQNFKSATNKRNDSDEKLEKEQKNSFKSKENFKTYDDSQNDRVINEKKESVKFDEKQSFPQFSLNVSNPISWKLMLLIMLMQLLTNMMLVVVLYLK